jgi:uncharacterized protein
LGIYQFTDWSGTFIFNQSMSSIHLSESVQGDWKNRESIEKVSLYILRITEFLNKFEQTTRTKLNVMNDKLARLERAMEHIEVQVASVEQAQQKN